MVQMNKKVNISNASLQQNCNIPTHYQHDRSAFVKRILKSIVALHLLNFKEIQSFLPRQQHSVGPDLAHIW